MESNSQYTFTDREILLAIANSQSFDWIKIDQLLLSIYAPPKLDLIIPLCRNLLNIISSAKKHSNILYGVDYQNWVDACEFIITNKTMITHFIGNHLSTNKRKNQRHPLYGYLSTYPIYSALLNTHESEKFLITYQLLQAQIFITHADYMQKTKPNAHKEVEYTGYDAIDNSANEAGRFLRQLSEAKQQKILKEIQQAKITLRQQKTSVITLPSKKIRLIMSILYLKGGDGSIISDINKILGKFFHHTSRPNKVQNRSWGSRDFNERRVAYVDGYTVLSDTFSQAPTNPVSNSPSSSLYIPHSKPPGDHSLDAPVAELSDGTELHLIGSNNTDNDTGNRPFVSTEPDSKDKSKNRRAVSANALGFLADEGKVRKMIQERQLLKHKWSSMTIWEAATFMDYCVVNANKSLQKLSESHDINQSLLHAKSCIVSLIMMFTGSSLERALKVVLWNSNEHISDDLVYQVDSKQWRINNVTTTRKQKPTKEQEALTNNTGTYFYLDDIACIGSLLIQLANYTKNKNRPFYRESITGHKKNIAIACSRLPNEHRASLDMLSSFFYNMILSSDDHNITVACMITGTIHLLASTTLYYTTLSNEFLENTYRNAATQTLENMQKEVPNLQFQLGSSMTEGYSGSWLCPTQETIRNHTAALTKTVRSNLKQRNQKSVIFYHNQYTLYIASMMAYGLGLRAVTDAFITLEEIDPVSGLILISDKDNRVNYHSRLVWVPEVIRRQLTHYENHKKKIHPFLVRTTGKPIDIESIPHLFFLDKNSKIHNISPKTIEQFAEPSLPLPANSNRRLLRSYLEVQGMSPELINCFMGHWFQGEEPWGKYSSFSYAKYISALEQHIPSLLKELGFSARQSHL